jgi:hypothetical protein
LSTTGVRFAGVRIAGEEGAATSVTRVALEGVVGAAGMATDTVVAGEVVAEETDSVAAKTWVAVDRDTKPLAVSFSWRLETPDTTGVPDDPAPQAAKPSRSNAETQPAPDRDGVGRIIEVAVICCRIGNP